MIRMRPKERPDGGQKDLFRARLDQIVDMNHPLAKLAAAIDWGFLDCAALAHARVSLSLA
jgi:IS5 family transposase